MLLAEPEAVQNLGVGRVRLVDDDDLPDLVAADLGQNGAHRRDLSLGVRMGPIHDVKQQVCLADLLQRRAECLDELGRQRTDEAHGVRQREGPTVRGLCPANGRVEGGEQLVVDQDSGAGEPVQQGGLAGIGVARDGHAGHAVDLAAVAFGVPRGLHRPDLTLQLGDPGVDPAPVELNLCLTGTT